METPHWSKLAQTEVIDASWIWPLTGSLKDSIHTGSSEAKFKISILINIRILIENFVKQNFFVEISILTKKF